MVKDILRSIGNDAQESGITYMELSASDLTDTLGSDNTFLSQLSVCDEIESGNNVKIRFLNMFGRSNDLPYTLDMLDRAVLIKSSKYLAGIDFAGHETNETSDFKDAIRAVIRESVQNNTGWTIRVHAGETATYDHNIQDVINIAKEFYDPNNPEAFKIRIGHGLNGIDDDLLEDMKEMGVVIELNASSNISLNNVNKFDDIATSARKYIDAGVGVVLGTDGCGIYKTTSMQEAIIASSRMGFTKADFDSIRTTELSYIARIQNLDEKRTDSFNQIRPDLSLTGGRYSSEFEKTVIQEKKESKDKLISTLKEKGSEILSWPEISDAKGVSLMLDQFKDMTGILIAGSSKNHWKTIPEDQKISIASDIRELLSIADPEKTYIITGGTNFGVEKLFHEINIEMGSKFKVIGLLSEKDTNTNDILDGSLSHAAVVPGNWWSKSDYQRLLIDKMDGAIKYVAVGGGAIVSDEITSIILHGQHDDLYLHSNCNGASKDKSSSRLHQGTSISSFTDFVEKANIEVLVKKEQEDQKYPQNKSSENCDETTEIHRINVLRIKNLLFRNISEYRERE